MCNEYKFFKTAYSNIEHIHYKLGAMIPKSGPNFEDPKFYKSSTISDGYYVLRPSKTMCKTKLFNFSTVYVYIYIDIYHFPKPTLRTTPRLQLFNTLYGPLTLTTWLLDLPSANAAVLKQRAFSFSASVILRRVLSKLAAIAVGDTEFMNCREGVGVDAPLGNLEA